jgi:hypothetical protein
MKNKIHIGFISVLTLAFWVAQLSAAPASGPKPGLRVVDPPGTWQEVLLGGRPGAAGNEISAGNAYYEFKGATLENVTPSTDPNWDWVTIYRGGTLTLKNIPGAPWYTKRDPQGTEYVFTDIKVVNYTRSTRYTDGQLDFALTGYMADGGAIFFGAYSGVPHITTTETKPTPIAIVSATLDLAAVKAPPPSK